MIRFSQLSALFLLAAMAGTIAGASDPEPAAPVVLKGFDPVELIDGRQVAGLDGIHSTRDGFRYRFADAEHKARFDTHPDRYAVQGRMCSVMPAVPASPDLFLVHDRKLYLFGSPRCLARFKASPADFLTAHKRRVAILVFEGVELLDFAGPGEVFATAGQGRAFEVFTVAASTSPIKSLGFATITPQFSFADCPKADLVVVPGGTMRIPLADPATRDWVKRASAEAELTMSVCTGALLLAEAGLLDGRQATTHHQSLAALEQAAPKAKVRDDCRFVDEGRVVTSAGVSSGIDASLHVVARLLGLDVATETAKVMEYRLDATKPN